MKSAIGPGMEVVSKMIARKSGGKMPFMKGKKPQGLPKKKIKLGMNT